MLKTIPAIILVLLIGSLPVFVVIGVRALINHDPDTSSETGLDATGEPQESRRFDQDLALERERIRAGQVCSDKSHWR